MKTKHRNLLTAIMILGFIGTMGPCYAMLFGLMKDWIAAVIMVPCSIIFTVIMLALNEQRK